MATGMWISPPCLEKRDNPKPSIKVRKSLQCCGLFEYRDSVQDPSPSGRVAGYPPLNGGKIGGVRSGADGRARHPNKRRRQMFRRTVSLTDTALAQSVARHAGRRRPRSPYAAVDLGHEAAGACEAPPHHRRDGGRPGDASTRPYRNGVRRSEGQSPAPPGPRNRRCRAARTPCRLRPRGATHPADPALADPGLRLPPRRPRPAPASRRSGPPAVSRGHGALDPGPAVLDRRRHLRAQRHPPCKASPVSTPRTAPRSGRAGAHGPRGIGGNGDEPEDPGTVHHARAGRTSPYPRKQL